MLNNYSTTSSPSCHLAMPPQTYHPSNYSTRNDVLQQLHQRTITARDVGAILRLTSRVELVLFSSTSSLQVQYTIGKTLSSLFLDEQK
mmetsp:Transcript_2256/g.4895  ORF Transcript_2256/g.4895 Transcript_2256/m.4895 type:complete len:88 (+) Transcript_2256:166-429(+)